MQFGLVVTDDRHGSAAVDLLTAAQKRGWECRCFLNDRGALLLIDPGFIGAPVFASTHVTVCELSVERYEHEGLKTGDIGSQVVIGGQYQNAELVHNSDCVLVL